MPSHFLVGEYMTRKERTRLNNWRCYLKTTECIQHASEDVQTDVQGAACQNMQGIVREPNTKAESHPT